MFVRLEEMFNCQNFLKAKSGRPPLIGETNLYLTVEVSDWADTEKWAPQYISDNFGYKSDINLKLGLIIHKSEAIKVK